MNDTNLELIRDICWEHGIRVISIDQVRSNVFSGTLDSDTPEIVYIKSYSNRRMDFINEVVEISEEVGLPECKAITGEKNLLVINQAEGRPLSRVLPTYLLPGFWVYKKNNLLNGYQMLGKYLFNLHSKTLRGERPALTHNELESYLSQIDRIDTYLDDATIADLRSIVTCLSERQFSQVIAHCDPSPHNIFYSNGSIELIDFTCAIEPPAFDLALVEFGINLMAKRLPHGRRSQAELLIDAFWKGYGSDHHWFDRDIINRFVAVFAARLLAYYDSTPQSLNSRLTRPIDVRLLQQMIPCLTSELD